MYCKNCGKQMQDGSAFCTECGASQNVIHNNTIVKSKTKKPVYKKWWFWVISVFVVIGIIGSLGGEDGTEKPEAVDNTPPIESSVPAQMENTQEQKDEAIELDARILDVVLRSEKVTTLLKDGIVLVSNGTGSTLDLYDLAKTAETSQQSLFGELSGLSGDNSKDYVLAAQYYVTNAKSAATDLKKYIDKQEMKYLSSSKEALESAAGYTLNVVSERMKYLSAAGFTSEEIADILEQSANQEQ